MSDSTPKKIPATAEPVTPPEQRAPRKVIPIWWIMSAGFHAVVFGWLVFFSPIRIINLDRAKAEYTAGTDKIQEVMDQVRVVQAERLAEDVRTLQEIQRELQELEASKQTEFASFAAEFATNAPSLAEHDQAAAAKAQAEALAAQQAAAATLAKAKQTKVADDAQAAGPAQQTAVGAQDRASQPMERALQELAMSDSSYEDARKAQADANELQRQSEKAQLEAIDVRDNTPWALQHAQQKQRDAEHTQESVTKAETDAVTAKDNLAKYRADADAAQADIQQLQAAAATDRTEADQLKDAAAQAKADYDKVAGKGADKKAARESSTQAQDRAKKAAAAATLAEGQAGSAKVKAESLQRKAERAATSLANAGNRVTQAKARAEQARTDAAQIQAKADEQEAKMVQVQDTAKALQADALQAQTKAQIALATARLNAATNTLAALTNMPALTATTLPAQPNVAGMDLANVYQTAIGTEKELTEVYKKIRATELAMLRQIPLQRAMELTDVAKVVHPDLANSLRAKPASGEDVPALREAVQTAGAEVNAMVNLGASLLMQAKGLNHGNSQGAEGATITLADIKAMSAHDAALEGLAAGDDSQRAKDLTGAMQAGAGQAGQGAGAGAGGQQGPGPKGKQGQPGLGGGGPPQMPKNMKALPGRKVNTTSPSTGWMFVDSWYIIGPFDNARRENIEKKFPPETVVDLNATYLGKDNTPIRWDFFQSPQAMVVPPFDHFRPQLKRHDYENDCEIRGLEYIIYYAYSELYFEQACDLWVAVGSDDYSKVWIEDQLVWSSGKQLKSWRADEGFRKVHFKQGLNRVLYRVENGWHGTQFSLVLCLK
jgi:hypothetical protein